MTYYSAFTLFLLLAALLGASQPSQANSTKQTVGSMPLIDQEIEVAGNTTNYTGVVKDGFVDFAMVVPAFTHDQIMRVQMSDLLSSQLDTIKVPLNDIEVPSNTTFPDQKERYTLINIRFNKPNFRYYVRAPGNYTMTAIHGKFPLKTVIKEVQDGKSLFEVLNHFEFLEGGSTKADIQGDTTGVDIAVNQQTFSKFLSAKAPTYPAGLVQLSVALAKKEGLYQATDLKKVLSNGEIKLKTLADDSPKFVASMLSNDESRIQVDGSRKELNLLSQIPWAMLSLNQTSLVLQAEGELIQAPQYLDFIDPPTVTEEFILSQPPNAANNMGPVATYLAFIEVEEIHTEQVDTEKSRILWSETYDGWVGELVKPKLDFQKQPNKIYRWQIMYLGQDHSLKTPDGSKILGTITHATRSSTDI